jgi:hypothetical protein
MSENYSTTFEYYQKLEAMLRQWDCHLRLKEYKAAIC